MKAVTWQGKRKVSVDSVPDPVIQEPTDAACGANDVTSMVTLYAREDLSVPSELIC